MLKRLLVVFFVSIGLTLSATVINIPADQPTIQAGIEAAVETDTVLVAPGTYSENIDFMGKAIKVASHYILAADSSYIDDTIINGTDGSLVTFTNSEDNTSILSGFTLTSGSAYEGGAIHCLDSSPTLDHLLVKYCWAEKGGAIFLYNASPELINCTITNNTATDGGSIYAEAYSHPELVNCILWDNTPQEVYFSDDDFLLLNEIPNQTTNEYSDNMVTLDLEDIVISNVPVQELDFSFASSFTTIEGDVYIDDGYLIINFFPQVDLAYHVANSAAVTLTVEHNGQIEEQIITCQYEPTAIAILGEVYDLYSEEIVTGSSFAGDYISILVNSLHSEFISFHNGENASIEIDNDDYYLSQRYFEIDEDSFIEFTIAPVQEDGTGFDQMEYNFNVSARWAGIGTFRYIVQPVMFLCLNDSYYGYEPSAQNIQDQTDAALSVSEATNGFLEFIEGETLLQGDNCAEAYNIYDNLIMVIWDPNLPSNGGNSVDILGNVITGSTLVYRGDYTTTLGTYYQETWQGLGPRDDHYGPFASIFCENGYCTVPDYPVPSDFNWMQRIYSREPGNLEHDTDPSYNTGNDRFEANDIYVEARRLWDALGADGRIFTATKLLGYAPKGSTSSRDIVAELPAGAVLERTFFNHRVIEATPQNYSNLGKKMLYPLSKPKDLQWNINGNELSLSWITKTSLEYDDQILDREHINLYLSISDQPFQRIAELQEDNYTMQLTEPGIYRLYLDAEYNGDSISSPSDFIEFAYQTDEPIYYRHMCTRSAPRLTAEHRSDNIDLSLSYMQDGSYEECSGKVIDIRYNRSVVYLSKDGSSFEPIYEGFLDNYTYISAEPGEYRFRVEVLYNDNLVSAASNTAYINTKEEKRTETDLVQVYDYKQQPQNRRSGREIDLSSITLNFSNIAGGEGGIITNEMAEINWETANLDIDPLFNEIFHLTQDSPCIDMGDPLFPFDPDNTPIDRGAFYYHQDQFIEVSEIYPTPGTTIEIDEGDSLTFYVTATDPDGNELEYDWQVNDEAAGTDSSFTFYTDYTSAGTYNISLELTDNYQPPSRNTLNYEWTVDVAEVSSSPEETLPAVTAIYQNAPNPFNPVTTIRFDLSKSAEVKLEIYNIKGQKVRTLIDEQQEAGYHSKVWGGTDDNGNPVGSGIYFYRLTIDGSAYPMRKCLLLK